MCAGLISQDMVQCWILLEGGKELSASVNCGEFLKYPYDYYFLGKDSVAWN
jgi:hypothetical protein